ncbi:MAG: hypothetical protein ACLVJO_07215 [[Clostridium] scindens]
MIALVLLRFSQLYIAYFGHIMGAKMEADMRGISRPQKLTFAFYDNQKVDIFYPGSPATCLISASLLHHELEDWHYLSSRL